MALSEAAQVPDAAFGSPQLFRGLERLSPEKDLSTSTQGSPQQLLLSLSLLKSISSSVSPTHVSTPVTHGHLRMRVLSGQKYRSTTQTSQLSVHLPCDLRDVTVLSGIITPVLPGSQGDS